MIARTKNLPVGAIATTVGLATLSNVYGAQGFSSVRYLTLVFACGMWLLALMKLTLHRQTFLEEYAQVVPASLYATFTMLTMIVGSFLFEFVPTLGRGLWLAGVILHAIHIGVFTYRNILRGVKRDTFVPSWFVTYAGILVAVVVGVPMGMPALLRGLMFYGFGLYVVLFPIMVVRLFKHPLLPQFGMTPVILLAPTSLVLVGYLNAFAEGIQPWIVSGLSVILGITLVYVASNLSLFLNKPFNPGHAALTFPTAIALVATMRLAGYLYSLEHVIASQWVGYLFGVQLWVTTGIMAYVGFGFFLKKAS